MVNKRVSGKRGLPEIGAGNSMKVPASAANARLLKLAKAGQQLAKEGGRGTGRIRNFYAGTYSTNT